MTGGFDPVALPPDRTTRWLILGALAALAVLLWAAWEDHHARREPLPLRPTVHPAWLEDTASSSVRLKALP